MKHFVISITFLDLNSLELNTIPMTFVNVEIWS